MSFGADELCAALAAAGVDFDRDDAITLLWDGLPTDASIVDRWLRIRVTVRRRHGRSRRTTVHPGDLGVACAFDSRTGRLEPLWPTPVRDDDEETRSRLAWLEFRGFERDVERAQVMLVRDAQTGAVAEETRAETYAARLTSAPDGAALAAALLRRWYAEPTEPKV